MKKIIVIAACVIIVGAFIGGFLKENIDKNAPPHEKVLKILNQKIDTSKSLFPPEETNTIVGMIEKEKDQLQSSQIITVEKTVDLGRKYKDLRDFDKALSLFAVADTMNPADLGYLLDKGGIYLELQQWEMARQVFEPMKVTWPVYQAYLGLATSYQHIEGTPNYVIDAIYEESIFRNLSNFEVAEAYAHWLEKTDRGEKAIYYYELMNQSVPQPQLEEKIRELKEKYNK